MKNKAIKNITLVSVSLLTLWGGAESKADTYRGTMTFYFSKNNTDSSTEIKTTADGGCVTQDTIDSFNKKTYTYPNTLVLPGKITINDCSNNYLNVNFWYTDPKTNQSVKVAQYQYLDAPEDASKNTRMVVGEHIFNDLWIDPNYTSMFQFENATCSNYNVPWNCSVYLLKKY